jgi:3-oxoacyl-[acyl-carrier-protein] synthase III
LNSELEISLSLIESGCLATSVNNQTVFIFKHSREIIESLRGVEKIAFELKCLKRPEFPTIVMLFYLEGNNNNLYQFEYSFAIEAEQEMELFKKLLEHDHFYIYFFDTRIQYSKMVSLNNNDAKNIKSIIIEATN